MSSLWMSKFFILNLLITQSSWAQVREHRLECSHGLMKPTEPDRLQKAARWVCPPLQHWSSMSAKTQPNNVQNLQYPRADFIHTWQTLPPPERTCWLGSGVLQSVPQLESGVPEHSFSLPPPWGIWWFARTSLRPNWKSLSMAWGDSWAKHVWKSSSSVWSSQVATAIGNYNLLTSTPHSHPHTEGSAYGPLPF